MKCPTARIALAIALAVSPALAGAAKASGADDARRHFSELLREQAALRRRAAMLEVESKLAAKTAPYILLDLASGSLQFRLRGKTFKTYFFSALSRDVDGESPLDPEAIWRQQPGPLQVLALQGGRPELIPPDAYTRRPVAERARNAGRPAPGITTPVSSDEGILGVEAPTQYYIRFDRNVVFHVRAADTRGAGPLARLRRLGRHLRASLARWWGNDPAATKEPLDIYLTTDPTTAKRLHYSLVPGEVIYLVPPPPPGLESTAVPGDVRGAGRLSARR